MPRYSYHPETVLQRANALIKIGNRARALDTLQEVFINKKRNYAWSETIMEPLMIMYLDLCIELKMLHYAKRGLLQYRNQFELVNPKSLENVILSYLWQAEEKVQLSSNALAKDDHIYIMYRAYVQCLQLLKNNEHVENLYHQISWRAMKFCLEYDRRTEFRNLCTELTKHLQNVFNAPEKYGSVYISRVDTQLLSFHTCLRRLEFATHMESWQAAYNALEDTNKIINICKKKLNSEMMTKYYENLAMVYWHTGNYALHALSLFNWLQFNEYNSSIMASRVLLATLVIPFLSDRPVFGRFIEGVLSPLEKAQELAIHVGFKKIPTRAEKYLLLRQYIPALQDVTLIRLVTQIAQVYETIQFSRLLDLAVFTTRFDLERLLVDIAIRSGMKIRIDHGKQRIHFSTDLDGSGRNDEFKDSSLQLVSDSVPMRYQLANTASVLNQAVDIIYHTRNKDEREKIINSMVINYHENELEERQRILQRPKPTQNRTTYFELKQKNIGRIDEIRRGLAFLGRDRPETLRGVEQIIDRYVAGEVEEDEYEYELKFKRILNVTFKERTKLLNVNISQEKENFVKQHKADLKEQNRLIHLKERAQERERNKNNKKTKREKRKIRVASNKKLDTRDFAES